MCAGRRGGVDDRAREVGTNVAITRDVTETYERDGPIL